MRRSPLRARQPLAQAQSIVSSIVSSTGVCCHACCCSCLTVHRVRARSRDALAAHLAWLTREASSRASLARVAATQYALVWMHVRRCLIQSSSGRDGRADDPGVDTSCLRCDPRPLTRPCQRAELGRAVARRCSRATNAKPNDEAEAAAAATGAAAAAAAIAAATAAAAVPKPKTALAAVAAAAAV